MPSRHEQERQRLDLESFLESQIRARELLPGQIVPSVRDLSQTHGLSIHGVRMALRALEERDLLETVERVGTFVKAEKTPPTVTATSSSHMTGVASGYFALIVNGDERNGISLMPPHIALCTGFENRIAELGGALLLMSAPQMLLRRERGELPELRGVFDVAWGEKGPFWTSEFNGSSVPHVHIGDNPVCYGRGDTVSFNDEQGAVLATRHLIDAGHTRIAFLGLHVGNEPLLSWSSRRETGWRKAMAAAHLDVANLAFCPHLPPHTDEPEVQTARGLNIDVQAHIAREAAMPLVELLQRGEFSAVVAANDATAVELLRLLEREQVPSVFWPALVGFDADPIEGRHWFTSLRLPWDELGGCAADLLWQRAHGLLQETPQHRNVEMRLIPRLSSRSQWRLRAAPLAESLLLQQ